MELMHGQRDISISTHPTDKFVRVRDRCRLGQALCDSASRCTVWCAGPHASTFVQDQAHRTTFWSVGLLWCHYGSVGWLGSRVVSVLDSGAEGPGFKSQPRRCRVTVSGKLFTPSVPLFRLAALLRVAGVTASLVESNGSLPPGLWLTSPAGWLPRTGISSGTLRLAVEYGLPLPLPFVWCHHDEKSSVAWLWCGHHGCGPPW